MTLLVLLVSFALVSQVYFFVLSDLEEARKPALDLSGKWELCLPERPSIEGCNWLDVSVPHELPTNLQPKIHGWLIYRKTFVPPQICMESDSACTLFFGEIGDSSEAKLNGITIGRRGDFPPHQVYFKHYPVRFDLSRDLLRSGENEILLIDYSMKKTQAGMREGPVGIFTATDGFKTAQSSIAYTIFVPLLAFFGLFIIGTITSLTVFIQKTDDGKIHSYVRYCFASALFLLSLSEIPREFLPIGLAGYLHSILRILSDWAYFEIIREYFGFGSKIKKWIRPAYMFVVLVFILNFVGDWVTNNLGNSGRGFDVSHVVLQWAFPLLLLPHCMGFIGALRLKEKQARFFLSFVFFVLALLQVRDGMIFHGIITGNYSVKIYPLFIGILMGFFFLERSRNERIRFLFEQAQAKQMELVHTELEDLAHELKMPLAGLVMGCDLISRNPSDPKPLQDAARFFPEEIASLRRKINAILKYSGEFVRPPQLRTQPVDLLELIRDVAERVKYASHRDDVEITVFGSQDAIIASVDREKMDSVFTNLFHNAIKASEGMSEPKVKVIIEGPTWLHPWIEVSVADNGPGIPVQIKDRLFEPFTTFGKKDGTGLGLPLSRRAIEAHGGVIEVSEYNKGTEFKILLPKKA